VTGKTEEMGKFGGNKYADEVTMEVIYLYLIIKALRFLVVRRFFWTILPLVVRKYCKYCHRLAKN
jgi:hypothetical protein